MAKVIKKGKKVTAKKAEKKVTAKKAEKAEKAVSKRASKSGKFSSIKLFMVHLFDTTPNITAEKAEGLVKKEFPNSKFNKAHFSHYRKNLTDFVGRKGKKAVEKKEVKKVSKKVSKKVIKKGSKKSSK
jgi:hypothetical protein